MVRVMAMLLVTAGLLALWLFCLVDIARTDPARRGNVAKAAWLLAVIVVPPIGVAGWLLLGRPRTAPPPRRASPDRASFPTAGPPAPDDDPEFLRRLREQLRRERGDPPR